jgi:hypothetical protein
MDARRRATRAALCAAALAAVLGGCTAKSKSTDGYVPDTAPFADAVGPSIYVPKVKALLTGLPATDDEVQRVIADPNALPLLIDGWMTNEPTRSLFEERMTDFFRTAFQQKVPNLDLIPQGMDLPGFDVSGDGTTRVTLLWSYEDSFARTALQLVHDGRPFNETLTTRRYMMTTAMMASMAYADMFDVDDAGDTVDRLRGKQVVAFDPLAVNGAGAPLSLEESAAAFDPGGNGTWTWRINVPSMTPECATTLQRVGSVTTEQWWPSSNIFETIFGNPGYPNPGNACAIDWNTGTNRSRPQFRKSDLSDWRMVTIEQIPIYEETLPTPHFWDLAGLRTATTLRLKSPHVGFLGTPAWFANWPTNESNQARVTANQALIVALGKSILPATAVAPAPSSATDTAHAANPACAACHVYLDPLRQFFRQSYTFSYHEQRDYTVVAAPARYMLDGMNIEGNGVGDLANILANHPHYATGWAQKLQFWATSNIADESDPDLQHVAAQFAASHFDFRALVRAVFSSPLVTLSRGTRTTRAAGTVNVGIARRDQLCAALSARVGYADLCERRWDTAPWNAREVTQMIADDGYYRAAELPAMPRNPDLFYRGSVEVLCERLANVLVDNGSNPPYSSANEASRTAAFERLVTTMMGIRPGDLRHADVVSLLAAHYTAATAAPVSAGRTDALRSAFVLACTSPTSVLLGL